VPGPRVGGLAPLTTIDFPGRLAAVVFFQGCPWRCVYCHNPHLIPANAPPALAWEDALAFLERRRGLLDGVVFSGGEPTLQAALPEAMREVRALGFQVALHTAGMYPERLAAVLPLVDWVGLDIKAPRAAYPRITGAPCAGDAVFESLSLILAAGVEHELRCTWPPPAAVLHRSGPAGRRTAGYGRRPPGHSGVPRRRPRIGIARHVSRRSRLGRRHRTGGAVPQPRAALGRIAHSDRARTQARATGPSGPFVP
jgi:pyruvate formate lyase activating enzyme